MPIVKTFTRLQEYAQRAQMPDINEMTGRPGRPDVSILIGRRMADLAAVKPGEVVVDIGCGDGTALVEISRRAQATLIGILPTAPEVFRCREHLRGRPITICQGTADATGLPEAGVDVAICSGVLLIVPDVNKALAEIARILKPGGRAIVGEMPTHNEAADKTYGASIVLWLWHVWRNNGAGHFWQSLRRVARALFSSNDMFLISPKAINHASVGEFIEAARSVGLTIVRHLPSCTCDSQIERIDYEFRGCAKIPPRTDSRCPQSTAPACIPPIAQTGAGYRR